MNRYWEVILMTCADILARVIVIAAIVSIIYCASENFAEVFIK